MNEATLRRLQRRLAELGEQTVTVTLALVEETAPLTLLPAGADPDGEGNRWEGLPVLGVVAQGDVVPVLRWGHTGIALGGRPMSRGSVTVPTAGQQSASSGPIEHGLGAEPAVVVATPRNSTNGKVDVVSRDEEEIVLRVAHRDASGTLANDTIVDWIAVL